MFNLGFNQGIRSIRLPLLKACFILHGHRFIHPPHWSG